MPYYHFYPLTINHLRNQDKFIIYPVHNDIMKHAAETDQVFTGDSLPVVTGDSLPVVKVVELGQGHPLQTWLIDLLIGQSIQKKDSGVRAHSFRSLGVIFLKGRLVKL